METATSSIVPLTIVDASHPIMDGPFGQVTSMGLKDASRYTALSGDVDVLSTWPNGDAAILVAGPTASRLGATIVLPDVERFLLDFDSTLGTGDTEIATLNAISFAVTTITTIPEPSTALLTSMGLVALSALRRRPRI